MLLAACEEQPPQQAPHDSGPSDTEAPEDDLEGDGYSSDEGDCDDTDPSTHPTADEYCDGVDNDCDGYIDLGAVDAIPWHMDADGDDYGCTTCITSGCDQPSGRVADNTDCDDSEASVNPGATEICDGLDNDCDGDVDEDGCDP